MALSPCSLPGHLRLFSQSRLCFVSWDIQCPDVLGCRYIRVVAIYSCGNLYIVCLSSVSSMSSGRIGGAAARNPPLVMLLVSLIGLSFLFLVFSDSVSSVTYSDCVSACYSQCIPVCSSRAIVDCPGSCYSGCGGFCQGLASGSSSSASRSSSSSSSARLDIECARYSDCLGCVGSGKRCLWAVATASCFPGTADIRGEVVTSPRRCIAGTVPSGTYKGLGGPFDINVNPLGNIPVVQGGSVKITVTLVFYGPVSRVRLGIDGLPNGATVSILSSGGGHVVLLVRVAPDVAPGSYQINVVGADDRVVRRVGADLVVKPSAPAPASSSKKVVQPRPVYGKVSPRPVY